MKYADLIRAALDGKKIQTRKPSSTNESLHVWRTMTDTSAIVRTLAAEYPSLEFRLEPEKKPDVVRFIGSAPAIGYVTALDARKALERFPEYQISKHVFDGETGKLKSVEIVE